MSRFGGLYSPHEQIFSLVGMRDDCGIERLQWNEYSFSTSQRASRGGAGHSGAHGGTLLAGDCT